MERIAAAADAAKVSRSDGVASNSFRRLRALAMQTAPDDPTVRQVRAQVQAFACSHIEVGIIPPKHRRDLRPLRIKRYVAEQLMDIKVVRWLRRMNALDYDIYCRPAIRADQRAEALIFVDDLTLQQLQQMDATGFNVGIAVESSPGRYHGWVRVSEVPIEREAVLAAAKALAARFGGDPAAASSRQFGRLAGFTNRKASRKTDRGAPFARLHASSSCIAPSGSILLSRIWENLANEHQSDVAARSECLESDLAVADVHDRKEVDATIASFLEVRSRCSAFRPDGTVDQSAADYGAAAALMERGWEDDVIVTAILLASPGLGGRHRNERAYAERTVAAVRERAMPKLPILRPR